MKIDVRDLVRVKCKEFTREEEDDDSFSVSASVLLVRKLLEFLETPSSGGDLPGLLSANISLNTQEEFVMQVFYED